MSQSEPDVQQNGRSIPAWAWFLVASLIAVSLIGILLVLLLKDDSSSTTAQADRQDVVQPIETEGEASGPRDVELTTPLSEGSTSASAANDNSASTTESSTASRETEDADPADTVTAADIAGDSSNGVVLISTFSSEDQKVGVGSGFLVDPSGLIATNFHVLRGCSRAEVEFRSGESIPVKGIRIYDQFSDLAILEIDRTPEESSVLQLADHAERPAASAVMSVGHPEQFKFTTTAGILSAVHRTSELPLPLRQVIKAPADNLWLQTTAVIAGGSSGGPLFNDQGEVIGINTWQTRSFSFASDVRHLQELLGELGDEVQLLENVTGPDQEFQMILADYQNKLRYFNQEYSTATTAESRAAMIAREPTPDYAERFLRLAEENPDVPICFTCLQYVCQLSLQAMEPHRCERQLTDATNLLIDDYCDDSRLSKMLWGFRGESSRTIHSFLEKLASTSNEHDIRGLAQYAMGVNYYSSGTDDNAKLAIAALQGVRNQFADVIYYCSDPRHPEHSIGTEAEALLYELETLWVGRPAPAINGKDEQGKPFSLDEFKGKVVVLDFWAAWCPPCINSLPHQKELLEKYADQPVEVIGVFCDDPEKLTPLSSTDQVTWRNWMDGPDGEIGNTYRIEAFPTIYVIDQKGKIHFRERGVVAPSQLHTIIDELLGDPEE